HHEHTALGNVAGGHQHLAVRRVVDAQLDLERGALVLSLVVHASPVCAAGLSDGNGNQPPHQYHFFSPCGRFLKRFMLHMYWLGATRTCFSMPAFSAATAASISSPYSASGSSSITTR